MNEIYQNILDQMAFDQNTIGFELRYNCSDSGLGYRIVFTEIDDMNSFDNPFMGISRPSVFNLNDFTPDMNLEQLFTYFVTAAYEIEEECLETMKPTEFYPEVFEIVSTGRTFLDSLQEGVDVPNSGTTLFSIAQGIIKLLVSTNLKDDQGSSIGLVARKTPSVH